MRSLSSDLSRLVSLALILLLLVVVEEGFEGGAAGLLVAFFLGCSICACLYLLIISILFFN